MVHDSFDIEESTDLMLLFLVLVMELSDRVTFGKEALKLICLISRERERECSKESEGGRSESE